jgi:hypothetical protein
MMLAAKEMAEISLEFLAVMASLIAVSVSYVQVLSEKCRKAGKKNEIACLLKHYNNDLPESFKFQAGIS